MQDIKRLIGNSAIVFFGTTLGSVFSYAFNMLMARMLGPSAYGDMTAIMSIMMITSVGGSAVLTIVMRYSGELYHQNEYGAITKLFNLFTKYLLLVSTLFFLIGLLFSRQVSDFFSISGISPLVLSFFGFFFGFLIMINRGILQGTQRFIPYSITNALEMLLRLALGIFLVKIGLQLNGSILAIVLATALTYFVTLPSLKKIFLLDNKKGSKQSFSFNKKEILNYSAPTLAATFLLTVFLNLDVILIKHYFPAAEAGEYAAISTIAKIIFYLTLPIISVMFPMVSEKRAKGEKHYRVLLLSLLIMSVLSLMVLGVYYAIPKFVIGLLSGTAYLSHSFLLPQIGVYILFYGLIYLLANYYMAIKDFRFLWFITAVIIALLLLVGLNHTSISQIIFYLTGGVGLLFVLLLVYYLYTKRERLALLILKKQGQI